MISCAFCLMAAMNHECMNPIFSKLLNWPLGSRLMINIILLHTIISGASSTAAMNSFEQPRGVVAQQSIHVRAHN